jgi:hypothetical protein
VVKRGYKKPEIMTQEQIVKENRLIAEFMGKFNVHDTKGYWECNNCGEQWSAMMGDDEVPQIHAECLPDLLTHAEYHTSWDWLIPVVEKIESFIFKSPLPDTYYEVRLLGSVYVSIISSNGDELINVDDAESKLEATYKAVIEFIKWYNKNKES